MLRALLEHHGASRVALGLRAEAVQAAQAVASVATLTFQKMELNDDDVTSDRLADMCGFAFGSLSCATAAVPPLLHHRSNHK